jgi:hypothetical protein
MRPRAVPAPPQASPAPSDRPNALVIAASRLANSAERIAAALRLLKSQTDASNTVFFARRGIKTARDCYARYLHWSGVFALDISEVLCVPNREARRPLPSEIVTAMSGCLAGSQA